MSSDPSRLLPALLAPFLCCLLLVVSDGGISAQSGPPLRGGDPDLFCDTMGFTEGSGIQAEVDGDGIRLVWSGAGSEDLRMDLGVLGEEFVIESLALRPAGDDWTEIGSNLGFEYRIVEGVRRISNQQLRPLRDLGVEITQEVVDRYKWDVFWDAPLDLSTEVSGGNPPPPEGVADQPGLPRSPDEIRRGDLQWGVVGCGLTSDGARASVRIDQVFLGRFHGYFELTVFSGTNLIETAVVASTGFPSVAYKYDVGITGLEISPGDAAGVGGPGPVAEPSLVSWRDLGGQMQRYFLGGSPNEDPVTLRAANRLAVAQTRAGAIAAFPPPHTFFWAREVEINVGYNWYRKDGPDSFSFGIRQGEEEAVDRYRANWALYSAPPGTPQRMAAYFYPTLGPGTTPALAPTDAAFDAALAFTNGDVYPSLPGYRVMGSHYHTNFGRELMSSGSLDTRLPDLQVLRSAGIEIVGPVDRPRDETQLEEQRWLFEGARRHSDSTFVVLPEMENSNLLGGHWDLLFSHPVFYVDERAPGTPLVTDHPEYGRMYNIGSVDDVMAMVEAENMLIYMPHPRTKGSTGYPDAVQDSDQFLSDRYRGVGWRWGMGSDLSEVRLSGKRVLPLLDDMNNWIAGTDLQPKYLLAITETYFKAPGDDIYANGPVSYLRLDELPTGPDYSPIIDALAAGEYFVTSGEVLIPEHEYRGSGDEMSIEARVRWTFPLDFVEVVWGDGEETGRHIVSATDLPAFGDHTFTIPFDGTDKAWVRFAAWDTAGNGAMTMPVRLPR